MYTFNIDPESPQEWLTALWSIAEDDGRFSWYQLDREMTHRTGTPPRDLMGTLKMLMSEKWIEADDAANPGQPVYRVTPAGIEALRAFEVPPNPFWPLRQSVASGCTEDRFKTMRCPTCGAGLILHVHPTKDVFAIGCAGSRPPHFFLHGRGRVIRPRWWSRYVSSGWFD
jgi:DNA-binding PadR family transcriptional regulator